MVKYKEVPGNALVSTLAYQRGLLRVAEQLVRVEHLLDALDEENVEVRSVTFRVPQEQGGDFLVTVRAFVEGKAMVAFHGSDSFAEAARGVFARLENRSVKWKDDQYAG